MMPDELHDSVLGGWDPEAARSFYTKLAPIAQKWFRCEVRGLDSFPSTGGVMLVSNHSGGLMTPDVLILASAFYREFGYDRPLYILGHDALFVGPLGTWQRRIGLIPASTANAVSALQSGGVVLVFPGGLYDSFRPTSRANSVDFNGRTGYVRTAIKAGVPIVPNVSIGGQQSQFFLTRGGWLAKRLGLSRLRTEVLPITFGVPFGMSIVMPPNIPLPTRIVAQVGAAIDIGAEFGEDPDVSDVDSHVRSVMQASLDDLARERRFPILG